MNRFRTMGGLTAVAAAVIGMAGAGPLVATAASTNQYRSYSVGSTGGEPSIGWDAKRNVAIYGETNITRLRWDDSKPRSPMTTTDVTPNSPTSLDPITIVDPYTSRTFASQLLGACSSTYYSDDAGANWSPSTGCGFGTLLDHQTLGAGPFHSPLTGGITNPDAVYYCAQNGFNEACAVSLDGGTSFGPASYIANTPANDPLDSNATFAAEGGACSALTGHVKVGPDGTAYVPLKGCGGTISAENATNTEYVGGHPSLSVSEDNGTTWTIRMVNDPAAQNPDEADPSLGIAKDGTLYFGWENGTNPSDFKNGDETQAKIAVSHDRGLTWSKPYDVSTALGLHNVQFPEVTAGDGDRAAFAFLGTAGIGDDQTNAFPNAGTSRDWHMYVATTYDGGTSWTTVDATPFKVVQKGCIDLQGTTVSQCTDVCSQRNLLDFNDASVDSLGRVLVAYADGCPSDCATSATGKSSGARDNVLRQSCGRGLYARYEPFTDCVGPLAGTPAVVAGNDMLPSTAGVPPLVPLAALVAALLAVLTVLGLARRRTPRQP